MLEEMNLFMIYHFEIPEFIQEFSETKEMQRLKNIGMHCGCEYTQFKSFQFIKSYSRWEHSIGVALIIWHFTKDIKQSIAGLLHDISTPVFAHVIDFLNNDYEKQESTEEKTFELIKYSEEIQTLLNKYNLTTEEVANYHLYPIADNDTPLLSSDRLEYTLGNFYCRGIKTKEEIQKIYDSIEVGVNEFNIEELIFNNKEQAEEFTLAMLDNARYYISDEDRFSMQYLADLLKEAIDKKVIEKKDLYTDEFSVIEEIKKDSSLAQKWNLFTSFYQLLCYENEQPFYCVNIPAKKRYIDVLVKEKRISASSIKIKKEITQFLGIKFDKWLSEESLN